MDAIRIPVSLGEIVDKITILEIKAERIDDASKLDNVRHELHALHKVWSEHFGEGLGQTSGAVADEVSILANRLKEANRTLWEIEDEIRDCERLQEFGTRFVSLARSVYVTNDERAAIKSEINRLLGSPLREEKSYKPYRSD